VRELQQPYTGGGCAAEMRLLAGLRRLVEHFTSHFTAINSSIIVMSLHQTSEHGSVLLVSILCVLLATYTIYRVAHKTRIV